MDLRHITAGRTDTAIILKEQGPRRVSPFFIPMSLINLTSGQISIRHGLKGPNHSVVTACATGAHAIGDAARMIALDDADVMVCGGAESSVVPIGIAGFLACKALCTAYNDAPEKASRPWDKDHSGFVMGEGAGIVVLEEYEHAKARGATIYAEVTGYGANSDGYDMVAPSGEGAERCMKLALDMAGNPKIDYLNPHGTSTPVGDSKEMEAVRAVFGDQMPMISSTKSLTGHSLGAAGAQEAIYCLLMMKHGFAAESAHIENLDPEFEGMPILRKRHDGELKLADLFGGRSQLIIYHFMFAEGWDEGCPGCSFLSDHIDGANQHLAHHDVAVVAVDTPEGRFLLNPTDPEAEPEANVAPEQAAGFMAAQEIVMKEHLWIPVMNPRMYQTTTKKVKGARAHMLFQYTFYKGLDTSP